ncbi:uncharacterized protein LOC121900797 [Thunnus maccoyii]|uniref:uncharacterized protein LOC121900797 n=1 Tax=Thunnus maccoyii TaxID=8240 RepID=UPI001C4CCC14|nr:uncharacterized protein LOC121900797 [Thunnus maccoyii]
MYTLHYTTAHPVLLFPCSPACYDSCPCFLHLVWSSPAGLPSALLFCPGTLHLVSTDLTLDLLPLPLTAPALFLVLSYQLKLTLACSPRFPGSSPIFNHRFPASNPIFNCMFPASSPSFPRTAFPFPSLQNEYLFAIISPFPHLECLHLGSPASPHITFHISQPHLSKTICAHWKNKSGTLCAIKHHLPPPPPPPPPPHCPVTSSGLALLLPLKCSDFRAYNGRRLRAPVKGSEADRGGHTGRPNGGSQGVCQTPSLLRKWK